MPERSFGVSLNEKPSVSASEVNHLSSVLIGNSEGMRALRSFIDALSRGSLCDPPVLLHGETGTGKSLVARIIHQQGRRRGAAFVEANCSAIPSTVFEGEMFGVARGAYHQQIHSPGYLEKAARGTLLLDEIGDLPLALQPKLLTALSSRRYYRVGDLAERPLDVQLLCATQHDLRDAARRGHFRQDLFYRICCNVCHIPPLRTRGSDDIAALLRHFIGRLLPSGPASLPLDHFLTADALQALYGHTWPGNVRELENLFQNIVICQKLWTGGKDKIQLRDIEKALDQNAQNAPHFTPDPRLAEDAPEGPLPPPGLTLAQLNQYLRDVKGAYVERSLRQNNGNKERTAKALGTSRSALYELLGHRAP